MNINEIIDRNEKIIRAAHKIVEDMNDGDKIKIPELAEKVAAQVNDKEDAVMAIVTGFVRNYDNLEIAIGRNGGVYKGKKPAKAAKVAKAVVKSEDSE